MSILKLFILMHLGKCLLSNLKKNSYVCEITDMNLQKKMFCKGPCANCYNLRNDYFDWKELTS